MFASEVHISVVMANDYTLHSKISSIISDLIFSYYFGISEFEIVYLQGNVKPGKYILQNYLNCGFSTKLYVK